MEDSNNINNIFREKFDTENVPKEAWNTPPDEIWSNIESSFPKHKEDSKRTTLIPFILSMSLLGFMFLGYKYLQKVQEIKTLEQKLQDCSVNQTQTLGQGKVDEPIVNANGLGIYSQIKDNKVNKKSLFSKYNNVNPSIILNTQRQNSEVINQNIITNNNLIPNTTDDSLPDEFVKDALTKDAGSGNIQNEDARQKFAINTLKSLNANTIKNSNAFDAGMLTPYTVSIKPVVKRPSHWMGGISAGYNIWVDKKNGNIEHPLSELLLSENTSPSIHYQINIKKKIGRSFAVNFGIGSYNRNQRSIYRLSLPYSTTNETLSGNELHNYFEHSLPTSLGNINTNLTLSRSINSNVTNNETVNLDFSLSNNVRALNIPLTFIYYPMKTGQGLFLESGINTEFIYTQSISNVSTHSFHSQVDDKDMKVAFDKKQIEQFNFTIPVGIGYSKRLTKELSVDILASYGFGINDVHTHNGFTHRIDRIMSQISIFKVW